VCVFDLISVALSILIGGITFTGSLIAFMKLSGSISSRAIVFTGQHLINLTLLILSIVVVVFALTDFSNANYMMILVVLSLVLGVLVVIPIGGACNLPLASYIQN